MIPVPTSAHNEALTGDTLYSAFLNYEWRQIVLPFVISGMQKIASGIEDESDRQDFEVLYGAMIEDFYNEDVVDGTPVGAIMAFANHGAIPAKWLLCNGSLISQATYPDLYAICGTIYGATSGGDFRLPELRGRVIFGARPGTPFYEQGEQGGVEATTISLSNMPEHHHVVPAHSHSILKASTVAGVNTRAAIGSNNAIADQATSIQPATNTSDEGAGAPFNIMNPYLQVSYIIKALP
jgi:microcystin-dependent protein